MRTWQGQDSTSSQQACTRASLFSYWPCHFPQETGRQGLLKVRTVSLAWRCLQVVGLDILDEAGGRGYIMPSGHLFPAWLQHLDD